MNSENELQQKDIDNLTNTISRIEKTMETGFTSVNTRLDIMNENFVKKDVLDDKFKYMQNEIDELKDSNKWLFRTIASVVIGIIISAVLIIK